MLFIAIVVFALWLSIVHFDKVLWLLNIPKVIFWFIESIPAFFFIAYQAVKATACFVLWFSFTWGFWPLSLWLIYTVQIKPYTH